MLKQTVATSQALVMQRALDSVSQGYVLWTSGTVPLPKAFKLAQKFDLIYDIGADRNKRQRKRKLEQGNAIALWWLPKEDSVDIHWWLFVSLNGEHPAKKTEQLHDALTPAGRLRIGVYELVLMPTKSPNPKPRTLTWRFTQSGYESWRTTLRSMVRNHTPRHLVSDRLHALFAAPGFRGIRQQIGKAAAFYRAEWQRVRGSEEMPKPPRHLGYIRRLPTTGLSLYSISESAKLRAKTQVQNIHIQGVAE